jgi:enoyl-CoA hydratase/carnithine racemase
MQAIRVSVPPLLNEAGIQVLRAELDVAFDSATAGVVVLEGGPECFCRGMDLGAVTGPALEENVAAFAACLERIRGGSKPVIAAVRGTCTAGGVGLAAAADIVIVSPDATFALTELLFGLVPAVILSYLLERLRPAQVRAWALSAQTWSAGEARSAGLVDVLPGVAGIERTLGAWVRRLGRAEPAAVGLWKRYTAPGGSPVGSAAVTVARLRDPAVLERIRRFTENEEVPWIERP